MFEHFNTLRVLFQPAKSVMGRYLEDNNIDAFEQQVDERTASHQPVVMVYGVYNAGKSTLINALLGEERAEVGDIPKTDCVEAYQIGDVTILDTPGIDAPIEHEQITREQLAKSDAIIFVLSSDGVLEEQSTYQEIERILRSDKPMLVVINNKNGYKPDDPVYVALKEKFRSNLYTHFANDEQILARLDKVPTYLVNAKAALNGKLGNKPALVEFSRLPALVTAVQRLFYETNSTQVAKTLSVQLQGLLQEAIDTAGRHNQDSDLGRLEDLIQDMRQSQTTLVQKVLTHSERSKPLLKNQLSQLLQEGNNADIGAVLEQWGAEQNEYFEDQRKREMRRLDAEAAEVSRLMLATEQHVPLESGHQARNDDQGFTDLMSVLVKKGIEYGYNEETVKRSMVGILKQGKKWLPSLFKGIGPKTMEKWATKALPFIGPAIDVAQAGWDYHKAREIENRQLDQHRQRLESVNLTVSDLVDNVHAALADSVQDAADDCYQPLINDLQQNLEILSGETSSLRADIATMQSLQQRLQQAFH